MLRISILVSHFIAFSNLISIMSGGKLQQSENLTGRWVCQVLSTHVAKTRLCDLLTTATDIIRAVKHSELAPYELKNTFFDVAIHMGAKTHDIFSILDKTTCPLLPTPYARIFQCTPLDNECINVAMMWTMWYRLCWVSQISIKNSSTASTKHKNSCIASGLCLQFIHRVGTTCVTWLI